MTYESIRYVVAENVAHIVLNRPHKKNALDMVMRDELWHAVAQARDDADVRAVLLAGAGSDFCAGGDVSTMRPGELDAEAGRIRISSVTRGAYSLLELPKPVIAAVDGCAYGAGFSLALASDIVLATERSRFCLSFLRLGLVPDAAALFTLPRAVGAYRAKHLLYTAQEIDGRTALDYGIAGELVAEDQLHDRAWQVAAAMAKMPPTAFALCKSALLRSFSAETAVMADMEMNGQGIAYSTQYHADAARRFLDKKGLPYSWPKPNKAPAPGGGGGQ
ncbi:enoyl-CoA hydratase/isomerase family protein [Pusillimonas sp. SM2304]|uniref:enoyl-CoA hydratase/isomerase family protein n=1 Tax=Pusillimonas sp. SM2304 TaxID=3073241 RepID=UPI002875860C|nr:enoyl-CoA hydratase/isomerase family protein [Pusillimonas sp. SM2304]MDS1140022.1 enoyl-CoA hydratase/isomerase family protein [Pusillimonas sp. SM2304]